MLPLSLALVIASDSVTIRFDQPTVNVPRSLFGVFFEEINNAGEGGVLGELLRNRGLALRDKPHPEGWEGEGVAFEANEKLNSVSPGSLRIPSGSSVINKGFWGIPVTKSSALQGQFWTKGGAASLDLVSPKGEVLASAKIKPSTGWAKSEVRFLPLKTEPKAHLVLKSAGSEATWLGYASLKPTDTFKGNGLRKDLAERINAMSPGFVRFPGGCYVEGNDFHNSFDWRATIKPIHERPSTPWIFWGYTSSNGMGYHEYLQWCEDLGSEPMFVVNCGLTHSSMTPMEEMHTKVKDALDAIEYANGPVTSPMGALRAKNGHPKPFNLKYLEIGNENGYSWAYGGLAAYIPRFEAINKAVKAKYPEIITISNVAVPNPGDLESEHYYDTPHWFWRNKDRYDKYDRKGVKIYVGEYACTRGVGRGSLAGALSEAAFMAGMERNADIVSLASYAPLFENINNRQWNPNAIVFDGTRSYGTPSYWVQKLFADYRVSKSFKVDIKAGDGLPPTVQGRFGLKTWHTSSEFKDVRITVDGKVKYDKTVPAMSDFAENQGEWIQSSESLKQSNTDKEAGVIFKDVTAGEKDNWTFEFTAKIVKGSEAFMAVFGATSLGECVQWNLGGWGNTQHAFQRNSGIEGTPIKAKIEAGQWRRVKVEKQGGVVRGYLDGIRIDTFKESPTPDLAASAGTTSDGKFVVLKLVNGSGKSRTLDIGAKGSWKGVILAGASGTDENTLEMPEKVAPRPTKVSAKPLVTLAPYSLTIFRVPMKDFGRKPLR